MTGEPGRLPGPVPVDGMEKTHVWPSWREAILNAKLGVETAYDRRRRVFQAAFNAGLTFRQIADAAGLSPAGVQKIIGKQRSAELDTPAFTEEGER